MISNYKKLLKVKEDIKKSYYLDYVSQHFFNATSKSVIEVGKKALDKMMFYNKKDVKDTESILKRVLPYIRLRRNSSAEKEGAGCITCGSNNLVPTKVITAGRTRYQQFDCLDHKGYGGRCTWYYKKGSHHKSYGKMG